ncbi:malectin domain-containing carbohydrate-binding protein [Algivirga pacifica]|uniref:Malectin domain-containing protein n=1 Tax=Algivirga pacifica TaxID=1162670 RepID=A0ABP9DAK1_9BACT
MKHLLALCCLLIPSLVLQAQQANFNFATLSGANIKQPTSLTFGPDGRLYVTEQYGNIYVYTIANNGGNYQVTATEKIDLVKKIPNYNDNGARNTNETSRLTTGILVAGTAAAPIVYVTSADGRSNGNDLDTNSGILSKLEKVGGQWQKVDLIRGLPRSREHHTINGMAINNNGTTLYMAVGGNTDAGAPGPGEFFHTPEYYLSASIIEINLTALNALPVWTDKRTGQKVVYDLPTLDDPNRPNITNASPDFPYPASHPYYNQTIDKGDPFGGGGGLNQAVLASSGSPISIYSTGYRNAYDVAFTKSGKLFTVDNGANGGKMPKIYNSNGGYKGNDPAKYNAGAGDYVTGEIGGELGKGTQDQLHYVPKGFYAGHPNPIRANPSKAGIYTYDKDGKLLSSNSGLMPGYLPNSPAEGKYIDHYNGADKSLATVFSSTNGLTEYQSGAFGGALNGSLIMAAMRDKDGNSNSYNRGMVLAMKPNANATSVTSIDTLATFDPSDVPLDVTVDSEGAIWTACYVSGRIVVLSPSGNNACLQPGDAGYDASADYDGDGFINSFEVQNGTNHCSAASTPADWDGDNTPDGADKDDDNDGISDIQDPFQIDKNNGLNTNLPVHLSFTPGVADGGFYNSGFTGMMSNGVTDYLDMTKGEIFTQNNPGVFGVKRVPNGDAYKTINSQQNAFQFGVNVDENTDPFIIHSRVNLSFTTPIEKPYYNIGIFLGDGTQDNYLKMVYQKKINEDPNIQVLTEKNAAPQVVTHQVSGLKSAVEIDFILRVNPKDSKVQAYISLDKGQTVKALGDPISIPKSWLSSEDQQGLAIGIISTVSGEGPDESAMWAFVNAVSEKDYYLGYPTKMVNFFPIVKGSGTATRSFSLGMANEEGAFPMKIESVQLEGNDAFSLENGNAKTVNSNATMDMVIKFDGSKSVGFKKANLKIKHSNGEVTIPVYGSITDALNGGSFINAGGEEYAMGGAIFVENTDNSTPLGARSVMSNTAKNKGINNTNNDALFYTKKVGKDFTYTATVPPGQYKLKLYFAELNQNAKVGDNVFNVVADGNILLQNFDVMEEAGEPLKALTKTFAITNTDGIIDLQFFTGIGGTGEAQVSAIGLEHYTDITAVVTEANMLKLYPNPANGTFSLENNGNLSGKVTFVNLQGAIMYQLDLLPGSKVNMPTSLLQGDMYLVRVAWDDGTYSVERLIINK